MSAPAQPRTHALVDALDRAHAEASSLCMGVQGIEARAAKNLVHELVLIRRKARGLLLVTGRVRPGELGGDRR